MTIEHTERTTTGRYNSLDEYCAFLDSDRFTYHGNRRIAREAGAHYSADWLGLTDAERGKGDAVKAVSDLANRGWERGADRLSKLVEQMEVPKLASIRRRRIRGEHGDDVDMQRVYTGRLETAWTRTQRLNRVHTPRVAIITDSIAEGGMNAERMLWRGAAAAALAGILCHAGYQVRMESGYRGSYGRRYFELRVMTKDYCQPYDYATAAATMALPGFFRAMGHKWYHMAAPEACSYGMNVHTINEAGEQERALELGTPHILIAPQGIECEAQAVAWVKSCVARLTQRAERDA